jgi:glyoxylase-like metal-dependent hydrolase (beta-lactamase superfamily II)
MARLVTIDCDYVQPQLAASYLREDGGEVAFIEANTAHAVPRLLQKLVAEGFSPEQVKYVVITHVHLDHAGGASALMRACPNATLLAHPRAARHAIDPSRLVASARKVYGDEAFDALYGTIEAIDPARVRALEDGATLSLGATRLRFLHARGHANHHFVVHDEGWNTVYTGDAFGLCYPALQRAKRLAYPSTSPTDFDGPAAIEAVKRVMALQPRLVGLTHFGLFDDVAVIGDQLIRWLELATKLCDEGTKSGDELGTLEQRYRGALEREFERAAARAGLALTDDDRLLFKFDAELNAQGIAFAAVKAREKSAT